MGHRLRTVALAAMTTRRALLLLTAGLAAVTASEWRAWQADLCRPAPSPPSPLPPGPRPRVSVLVAAWRERGRIGRLLRSFDALRYPNKELVLCAGGDDGTWDEALRHAGEGVRLLVQQPGEGKWRALRRCLDEASGEIIFLTDADCVLDDAAFEATLTPLLRGDATVTTGHSVPFPEEERRSPLVAAQGDEERYLNALSGVESLGMHGRNAAMLRTALQAAGGFAGEVATGTDYALARRLRAAGFRIRAVPGSVVRSSYHDRVAAYSRQRSRWLRNLALHGYAAGDWGEVRHALTTGLLGVALLGGPVAGLVAGPEIMAVWTVIFAKAGAARVRRRLAVRRWSPDARHSPAWWIVLTPLWVVVDAWAWTLSLIDLLLPSRRRRW